MAETSRGRQLQKLAQNLPGGNQEIQQGLQQGRATQLQQQVKQMGPAAGVNQAQQLGAEQAAKSGAIKTAGAQQQAQQQTQVGQMALQEQGREQRQSGFEQQIELSQHDRANAAKLDKMGMGLKNKLLDSQLQFQKDEGGNALFKNRQLLDWAVTKAQSKEELMEYIQTADKVQKRKMQMIQHIHNTLTQTLKQGYIKKNKPLDHASRLKIQKMVNDAKRSMQKAQAKAANKSAQKSAIFGTIGAIGGAIVGAYVGGPAGAVAGASAGQKLGEGAAQSFG